MEKIYHPYHLVNPSPWPYVMSCGVFLSIVGAVIYFHYSQLSLFLLGMIMISVCLILWLSDMMSESTFQGFHTKTTVLGLKMGFMLFMISEILFFFSFFWAFFHSSLSPSVEMGMIWPPLGMNSLNPFSVPLLNTVILLSSGATVTWTHHSIISGNSMEAIQSLGLTLILGMLFTVFQVLEYIEAPFCMADSMYGSTFFMATGFHGFHVIIGTMFLLICFSSLILSHFTSSHHFGFEAASWYWHFVDVVWLFLYVCMYWWGC